MDIFEKTYENCDSNRNSINRYNNKLRKYLTKVCDYTFPLDLNFILGPYIFSEFNINGNKIAIFGETHNIDYEAYSELTNFESLPFSSFLKSLLLLNPSTKYDFFLEIDYVNEHNSIRERIDPDAGPMISLLEDDFLNCFTFVKNCPYPNLNTHYIDYRVNWKKEYLYKDLYPLLTINNTLKKNPGEIIYSENYRILQNTNSLYTANYNFIKNEVKNTIGISKEFLNNPYSSKIKSFIYKKLYDHKKSFKEFRNKNLVKLNFIKNNDVMAVEFSDILYNLGYEFLKIAGLILDMYLLARLTRKTLAIKTNPSKSIVYVGATHARNVIEFFNYIKAELIYDSEFEPSYKGETDPGGLIYPGIYLSDETKSLSFLFEIHR